MRTVFYDDPLPGALAGASGSIFLAGPTATGAGRTPWRAEALEILAERGFRGAAVLPEFRDSSFAEAGERVFGTGDCPVPHMRVTTYNILQWETAGIEGVDVVVFWMPFLLAAQSDPASLPGFTTRAEVGRELGRHPSRLVLGMPPGALSGGHIRYHAFQAGITVHSSLVSTIAAALTKLG